MSLFRLGTNILGMLLLAVTLARQADCLHDDMSHKLLTPHCTIL